MVSECQVNRGDANKYQAKRPLHQVKRTLPNLLLNTTLHHYQVSCSVIMQFLTQQILIVIIRLCEPLETKVHSLEKQRFNFKVPHYKKFMVYKIKYCQCQEKQIASLQKTSVISRSSVLMLPRHRYRWSTKMMFYTLTVKIQYNQFNPLNAELNPIRHLLALVGARHIVHVSRIRVNQAVKNK